MLLIVNFDILSQVGDGPYWYFVNCEVKDVCDWLENQPIIYSHIITF